MIVAALSQLADAIDAIKAVRCAQGCVHRFFAQFYGFDHEIRQPLTGFGEAKLIRLVHLIIEAVVHESDQIRHNGFCTPHFPPESRPDRRWRSPRVFHQDFTDYAYA